MASLTKFPLGAGRGPSCPSAGSLKLCLCPADRRHLPTPMHALPPASSSLIKNACSLVSSPDHPLHREDSRCLSPSYFPSKRILMSAIIKLKPLASAMLSDTSPPKPETKTRNVDYYL